MKIKLDKKLKASSKLLVIPVFTEDLKKAPAAFPKEVKDFLKLRNNAKDFTGKKLESLSTYSSGKNMPEQLFFVGCGGKKELNVETAKEVAGRIAKEAKQLKRTDVAILLHEELTPSLQDFLEAYISAQYSPALFKTDKKAPNYNTKTLSIVVSSITKDLKSGIVAAQLIADAANFVRTLVNSPANKITPKTMAAEAERIARKNRYKKVILGDRQLKKLGCGGILGVNSGSDQEAKLIVLEHNGGPRNQKPLVLVGKGVIFDTGGYNMKPTGSMETMQQDMAGGATVLGVFEVLKKLGIKKNVVGIVPVVQNMVNEHAYRPSDILEMFSGKTVEVTNTDAEGRLILADAIHYATKLKPEAIVTIATLTGAVGVALGNRYCGVMGNNDEFRSELVKAGAEVDELAWPLPIHDHYRKCMDSEVADIRNYDRGTGRMGGTVKAAAFLEKFVGENKWCHIDIGGTAFTTSPKQYQNKGATAHGFRLLVQLIKNLSV